LFAGVCVLIVGGCLESKYVLQSLFVRVVVCKFVGVHLM